MAAQLGDTFAALADPTRLAIVETLTRGDATINELTDRSTLTQQSISKHVKVLEDAGLVTRTRIGTSRPCHLEVHRLDAAQRWLAGRRDEWVARHDRLSEHLSSIVEQGKGHG